MPTTDQQARAVVTNRSLPPHRATARLLVAGTTGVLP